MDIALVWVVCMFFCFGAGYAVCRLLQHEQPRDAKGRFTR